ncbi:MAG: TfoX/Sxy family protein [Saprospiraceae bacterium]|nr:TfoX/Sxy family protein [Saprospiraceae bacterium]
MSYDELLASRIRRVLKNKQASFVEKKMMGGLCFMVNDKMCCGIHFDKKKNTDLLMARVGEKAYPEALKNRHCQPMDFTGRPMKGFVFIIPDGYDLDKDLEYWVQLCLDFNPEAKSHK